MAAILLVSADPSLDGAYQQALNARGYTVICVSGVTEAVRALLTLKVEAIVLDTRLVGDYGDLQRWLRADPERARVPVLYLVPPGALDFDIAPPACFRPEVDAALPRPFAPDRLADVVAALLGAPGREEFEEEVRAGPFSINLRRRIFSAGERSVPVTPIEGRILRYLMERPGVAVSVEELLVKVWGYFPGTGGSEAVRAHARNIRRKIQQLAPGRDVLLTIPRLGYRFVVDVEGGRP